MADVPLDGGWDGGIQQPGSRIENLYQNISETFKNQKE